MHAGFAPAVFCLKIRSQSTDMETPCSASDSEPQLISVPQGDRWRVHRRLQELSINAWCPTGGQLQVEVNTHVEAAQVWSVVRQFSASRTTLVVWLERCWHQVPPAHDR
jgi:hypothetical protein